METHTRSLCEVTMQFEERQIDLKQYRTALDGLKVAVRAELAARTGTTSPEEMEKCFFKNFYADYARRRLAEHASLTHPSHVNASAAP